MSHYGTKVHIIKKEASSREHYFFCSLDFFPETSSFEEQIHKGRIFKALITALNLLLLKSAITHLLCSVGSDF